MTSEAVLLRSARMSVRSDFTMRERCSGVRDLVARIGRLCRELGEVGGPPPIIASALTDHDGDDGSQLGPLLDQVGGPVASVTADGAFDRDDVYAEVAARHPEAAVIVPPRSGAVPSDSADTAPTQRDRHIEAIAEHGRMGWQKASGYNRRALVEMACSQTINSA